MTEKEIPVTGQKFEVGGQAVAKLTVRSIGFKAFADGIGEASKDAVGTKDFAAKIMRRRFLMQATAFDASGKKIPLDRTTIGRMPSALALKVREAIEELEAEETAEGFEVLSSGDGMTTPIHVRLSNPIKASDGKSIPELEFMASTLDELEEFMTTDSRIDATLAAFAFAKPVGSDLSLIALPSWAVDQITMADGSALMKHVVGRIQGEQEG